jgi:hypothetical protein
MPRSHIELTEWEIRGIVEALNNRGIELDIDRVLARPQHKPLAPGERRGRLEEVNTQLGDLTHEIEHAEEELENLKRSKRTLDARRFSSMDNLILLKESVIGRLRSHHSALTEEKGRLEKDLE